MRFTEWAWETREKVAKLRTSISQQISDIPHPKILKASDFSFTAPDLWDMTGGLSVSESINVQGGDIMIPQPYYDVGANEIPLKNQLLSLSPNPTLGMETTFIDVSFPAANFSNLNARVIDIVDTIIIPFAQIKTEKINIFGMNYADKHWHKITISTEPSKIQQGTTQRNSERRDLDFSELPKRGRKVKKQQPQPTIWDLLFAVLQPPLNFGQSESLFLPNPPYPYQWQGIKFLMENEHALLADDMGTGKTVMTTVALKILIQQAKIHHVLILCPPSVLHEWDRHLGEWASELTAYLIRNPQKDVRKTLWDTPMHVYVTTYDTLRSDIENGTLSKERFNHFDVVILDEAHHIKNTKSSRFRALKRLQPKKRWALTGTPVQNKLEDLASIFDFVYPGFLTPYDLYPQRIQEKIRPHFLRRRKKEVMPDLPPKQLQPFELELDIEQEVAYRQAEAGIRLELSNLGDRVTKQHIFAKLTILKQICNFAPRKSSSPKTDLLKEQIEEIIEDENKVIIFSQFVEEGVSKLEKILEPYGVAKIVGGQSDSVRKAEIEKFKRRKDIPILIASVRSGGEGLNLTEASYVVHFDHWWNPAVMWQAEDRVHRRGQTKGVNVYSYWMRDTVDDRIRKKLSEKGILFDKVVDGLAEESIDELFTTDEWLEIFGVKNIAINQKSSFDLKGLQSLSLAEIRERMYEMKPSEFEELVKELMHYLGYPNVKVTGKSHDGGIDVLSTKNTTNGVERVAAQCKRYRGNVSVSAARDFFGAISSDKSIKSGFLVTTGEFTSEALQFCISAGKIRAISGLELAKYVKQFGLPVR